MYPPPRYITSSSLNHWYNAGCMHSCCLQQIQVLLSDCCTELKTWASVNSSTSFPFLADRSGTRCGLLLLLPICFKIWCTAHFLHTLVVTGGYLSYCYLSISLKQPDHWCQLCPLTSTQQFLPDNCRPLAIFSFSDGKLWRWLCVKILADQFIFPKFRLIQDSILVENLNFSQTSHKKHRKNKRKFPNLSEAMIVKLCKPNYAHMYPVVLTFN